MLILHYLEILKSSFSEKKGLLHTVVTVKQAHIFILARQLYPDYRFKLAISTYWMTHSTSIISFISFNMCFISAHRKLIFQRKLATESRRLPRTKGYSAGES